MQNQMNVKTMSSLQWECSLISPVSPKCQSQLLKKLPKLLDAVKFQLSQSK